MGASFFMLGELYEFGTSHKSPAQYLGRWPGKMLYTGALAAGWVALPSCTQAFPGVLTLYHLQNGFYSPFTASGCTFAQLVLSVTKAAP